MTVIIRGRSPRTLHFAPLILGNGAREGKLEPPPKIPSGPLLEANAQIGKVLVTL